uniref:Uncharacterized protein n=1 Tax=Pseudomonas phage RVTF4 TaxID=3236931 RepID=A0AB39CDH6_9VIRU
MAVAKRLLESRREWISRVLSTESVDYCLIRHKVTGEEWLVFTESRPGSHSPDLGGHRLSAGPEIGRMVVEEKRLKDCEIEFYTYDPKPKLSGVIHDGTGKELRDKIYGLESSHKLPRYKGKHLFTDPHGRRWFMFTDTTPSRHNMTRDPVLFKLTCERGIENYGGQGWMSMEHIHLYKGTWHFENLDNPPVLLDETARMNLAGTIQISEQHAKLYTIEETCDRDTATFTVKGQKDGYACDIKHYKLTLHLKGLCKETQALDIADIIHMICRIEFNQQEVVFRESELRIEYDERGPMFASSVRSNCGARYYNTMSTSKQNWSYVSVTRAALSRNFA